MADDKDLKKLLDDWQTRMAGDTRLVDQINEELKAQYDRTGTAAKDRTLLGTDEATRKTYAATVRKATANAIESSPGLKADFIAEIGAGRVARLEIAPRSLGAGGAYDAGNDTMLINPAIALMAARKDTDKAMLPVHREMVGIIGHELDHSQRKTEGKAEFDAFKAGAEKILNDGKDQHDYSKVIGDQLAARSASESRAQLDYYNSIVQSLPAKDRTEAKIFAAIPDDRKKDFFDTDKGTRLPGLKVDPPASGLLPQTADNIKAMQSSFFERPQFGPNNRETYKEQVAGELVRTILSLDKAKDVTINLKAMGVDYSAIQPYLKDIKPPKTFYDDSSGTRIQFDTDKAAPVAAPAKTPPASADPAKPEPAKTDARPAKVDGGSSQKLPDAATPAEASTHPLYAQALRQLQALGPDKGGYATQGEMRGIAGAIAEAAQQRPLRAIESLTPSVDGKGLIATWTNPANPFDIDRVYIDKSAARDQPLEQTLQRLVADTTVAQGEQTRASAVTR